MRPVLQALILAERVYQDKSSGKMIICGTFDRLDFVPFPNQVLELPDGKKQSMVTGGTDPGCPTAYISLTDVVDGTELTVQFFNQSKNEVVIATGFRIERADRLANIQVVLPLPRLQSFVTNAGIYSLDVLWKGELLGSLRVIVTKNEKSHEGESS